MNWPKCEHYGKSDDCTRLCPVNANAQCEIVPRRNERRKMALAAIRAYCAKKSDNFKPGGVIETDCINYEPWNYLREEENQVKQDIEAILKEYEL